MWGHSGGATITQRYTLRAPPSGQNHVATIHQSAVRHDQPVTKCYHKICPVCIGCHSRWEVETDSRWHHWVDSSVIGSHSCHEVESEFISVILWGCDCMLVTSWGWQLLDVRDIKNLTVIVCQWHDEVDSSGIGCRWHHEIDSSVIWYQSSSSQSPL